MHALVYAKYTNTHTHTSTHPIDCIINGRHAVFGSANINDRSMLGHRNSELALYLRDTETHEVKIY